MVPALGEQPAGRLWHEAWGQQEEEQEEGGQGDGHLEVWLGGVQDTYLEVGPCGEQEGETGDQQVAQGPEYLVRLVDLPWITGGHLVSHPYKGGPQASSKLGVTS